MNGKNYLHLCMILYNENFLNLQIDAVLILYMPSVE